MKIYFSGSGSIDNESDPRLGTPRYRLFSCHGAYYRIADRQWPYMESAHGNFGVMLDSGAFTAWSKGEEMTLRELIPRYETLLNKYAHLGGEIWLINLDKIPGSPGVDPTPAEIDEAIRISDENYNELVKRFGHRVLPVFHQGESEARLREVVDMSDNYINVSPRNDLAEVFRSAWAREVHMKLDPSVKTHGLAATGLTMVRACAWHSVDSASALMLASYGKIWRPGTMALIAISEDSPTIKREWEHYDNISQAERDEWDFWFHEWGFDAATMKTSHHERTLWNRLVIHNIGLAQDHVNKPPPVQEALFDL